MHMTMTLNTTKPVLMLPMVSPFIRSERPTRHPLEGVQSQQPALSELGANVSVGVGGGASQGTNPFARGPGYAYKSAGGGPSALGKRSMTARSEGA